MLLYFTGSICLPFAADIPVRTTAVKYAAMLYIRLENFYQSVCLFPVIHPLFIGIDEQPFIRKQPVADGRKPVAQCPDYNQVVADLDMFSDSQALSACLIPAISASEACNAFIPGMYALSLAAISCS